MKWSISILFFFVLSFGRSQDINIGILGGFNAYQNLKWNRAVFIPENSYHFYIEDNIGEGLLNKHSAFNAVHFGIILNTKYKRFSFNIEPQFFYQKTYITFEKPFLVERNIGKRAFRMPTYFTYKLFKTPKSFFLLIGGNIIKERNWDFQNPGFDYYFGDEEDFKLQFQTGDGHFEGYLYDNNVYWNALIGIGKAGKKWNGSIRLQQKLDITKHQIEATGWQIEMSFNLLFLSSRDFTKKHFLYEEE